MYETYWRLSAKPFGSGCETPFYYPADGHQAALLKLRYAIESRRGAALVTGNAGTGKSLVARLAAERLPDDCVAPIYVTYPQMPPANLLAYLAHELQSPGETIGREPPIDESVRAVQRRLLDEARAGRHTTIFVDDAHLLEGTRTFEALRLLLNTEHDGRPTATIILVGQTALLPIIERLPQWEQRLAVKCLLRSFTLDETHAYVQHRLQTAGAEQTIFEHEAVEALHAISQGTPRDINRLADLALLMGYADGAGTIAAEGIAAVAGELVNLAAE